MSERLGKSGLQVAPELVTFIETKALPGTGVSADTFWSGLSQIVHELGPKNRALLERRAELQGQIDAWHIAHKDQALDAA
ncbi:MAG: malate synthase, partial [Paracoccaceae bacterium]